MAVLVTGGAGFIGANYIIDWLQENDELVVNLDKLTYAGNICNLSDLEGDDRHVFVKGDIGDKQLVEHLLGKHKPRAIINFAAESHVDRSIFAPEEFMQTNVIGTFRLLEAARAYWKELPEEDRAAFRFLHVSTDEIYGSLAPDDPPFSETSRYQPNSPYSASKAAADHLVRAYHHTYGLPVITTSCSNNYGPYQFPEKLIPLIIQNALSGKALPIYGDGMHIRDWLYVGAHCSAIRTVLDKGVLGEVYNIGGRNQKTNLEITNSLCDILDELRPLGEEAAITSYRELISFVRDRPGHDRRYAIDATKIERELGWRPAETFETGIRKTVEWYLDNLDWVEQVKGDDYRNGSLGNMREDSRFG